MKILWMLLSVILICGCVMPRDQVANQILQMRKIKTNEAQDVIVEMMIDGDKYPLSMVKDSDGNFIINPTRIRTRYELISRTAETN